MSDEKNLTTQAAREVRVPGREVGPAQPQVEPAKASTSTVIEGQFTEVKAAEPVEKAEDAQRGGGQKIGAGHLKGMMRLGFHELANALQAFPDSNINAPEEPGVFGNENAPQRPKDEPQKGSNKHLEGFVGRIKQQVDQELTR